MIRTCKPDRCRKCWNYLCRQLCFLCSIGILFATVLPPPPQSCFARILCNLLHIPSLVCSLFLSCWRYTSQYFDYCYKWYYTVTRLQPSAVNKGQVLPSDEHSDEHHWTVQYYIPSSEWNTYHIHFCIYQMYFRLTTFTKTLPKYNFTYILLLLIAITYMHGGQLSKMIWYIYIYIYIYSNESRYQET